MKYLIILGFHLRKINYLELTRKHSRLLLLTLTILATSCSTNNVIDESSELIPDIVVFGTTSTAVMQANITSGNSTNSIDLTQLFGVDPNSSFMPINSNSNLVGYYLFPQGSYGNYSVWEKDIVTDVFSEYTTPCGLVIDEPYFFPKVFEDIIAIFSTSGGPNNTTLLSLNIFNKDSGFCTQISLGETSAIQRPFRIMKGDEILTYHVRPNQESVITKINVSTGIIEDELIHNGQASVVLQGDILHAYLRVPNLQHLRYNFDSFGFNGQNSVSNNLFLETGLFETSFNANDMLIELPYLQPSQFSHGPALLNLDSGEFNRIADIPQIEANLVAFLDINEQVELSDFYEIALEENLITGAYYVGTSTEGNYGIYFANLDGTMLSTTNLDFEPEKIIFR